VWASHTVALQAPKLHMKRKNYRFIEKKREKQRPTAFGWSPVFSCSSRAGCAPGGRTEELVALRNLCCPSAPVPTAPPPVPGEGMGGGCWKAENQSGATAN